MTGYEGTAAPAARRQRLHNDDGSYTVELVLWTPVIALLLSTLFEGYRWTWVGAVGLVLAVAGNWLALRGKR